MMIVNKKARFEYFFLETMEVGIVLKGTEVKSIRESKVQLKEAWCSIEGGELWVKDLHITPYSHGNIHNVEAMRPRKLLAKRKEMDKWKKKMEQGGLTIVVSKIYFNEKGKCKLEIALAKGKKLYDKRDTLKDRDIQREIEREM